jgi:hypothetical protein
MRPRAGSVKRKIDDSVSYASVATANLNNQRPVLIDKEKVDKMTVDIAKVTSLCEKIDTALESAPEDPLKTVLMDISMAIKTVNENQSEIIKGLTPTTTSGSDTGMINLGGIPKRNRMGNSFVPPVTPTSPAVPYVSDTTASLPVPSNSAVRNPSELPEENVRPEIKKFRDAVSKAESSTLIFNLNLGRVPIMNTATMSTKATLALTAMAAETENQTSNMQAEDTVATIDDILSMAKSIEFYGRKTKSYVNPKDSKSGSYCTVPVRYEFEDRETRFEAEKYLPLGMY